MCGRYYLKAPPEKLTRALGASIDFGGSYNICPGQSVPALISHHGERRAGLMQWGLIPAWSKQRNIQFRTINACIETVAEKPAYRNAWKKRHCVIPASGFYEWQQHDGKKQPMLVTPQDADFLFLAGLWEGWTDPETSERIYSFSIITRDASGPLEQVHRRMPLLLQAEMLDRWLECKSTRDELSTEKNGVRIQITPVSTRVNNTRHDDEACIAATGPSVRT